MSKKLWNIVGAVLWDLGLGITLLGMGAILLSDIVKADQLLTGVIMVVIGPMLFGSGIFVKMISVEDDS